MSTQSLLEVSGISRRFGGLMALRNVSFKVNRGEIVGLIGPNGAGKTTAFNVITGTLPPSSGEVRYEGRRISGLPPSRVVVAGLVSPAGGSIRFDGKDITAVNPAVRVRDGISLSPEGRRLFGRMTVLDNLLTGAYTVSSASVIKSTLDEIYGLFPRVRERRHQLAGSLSGGEQQMVAIGRALMAQPRLLMLDEPSLGIAPKVVAEIAHAIQRINRDKKISVILVEQNARLALRLSHNAYALEHGEVVRSGCGDELLADPFVQKAYLGV